MTVPVKVVGDGKPKKGEKTEKGREQETKGLKRPTAGRDSAKKGKKTAQKAAKQAAKSVDKKKAAANPTTEGDAQTKLWNNFKRNVKKIGQVISEELFRMREILFTFDDPQPEVKDHGRRPYHAHQDDQRPYHNGRPCAASGSREALLQHCADDAVQESLV